MTPSAPEGRSREACPVCGMHALHLLYFPAIDVDSVRPYDEMLGYRTAKSNEAPGIGCGSCGAEWPDLEAFRAAGTRT